MKTISIPVQNYVKYGNTLTEWLGYFWTRVYENPDFTRNLQQGQGLLAAQLYLNYLESINLRDRNNGPVFHRERWKPVVIRKSQAGTGNAAALKIGMDPTPVIGPQLGGAYPMGEVFQLGGAVDYFGTISYPFEGISDVATCLTDNIVAPTVVLTRNKDFVIVDSTVFFLRGNDPFELGFPQRTITDADGVEDTEIILWASDALIDTQYVYNYIGYVMGLKTESSEFYQTMLNALWDLYNDGTPIGLFRSAVGAMLGEPTIISGTETVDRIVEEGGVRLVITDKHVYRTHLDATLRESVVPGTVMESGEFLTQTVRLYETLNPMKMDAVSEYGERMRTDLASMFFDRDMMRTPLKFGVGADWEYTNIVCAGVDGNGNPKLMFQLYGDPEDLADFWTDFWDYCENHDISSATCFADYIDGTVFPVVGAVYGRIQPMEFLMRYFLRANAFAIVVEPDKLSEPPTDRNPVGLLTLMRDVLPAHVRMIVIEHRQVGDEDYNLATILGSDVLQATAVILSDDVTYGLPSTYGLTYMDRRPVVKQMSVCKS